MMGCSQSGERILLCTGGAKRVEHHESVVIFDVLSRERFVSYNFMLCISASENGFHHNLHFVVQFNDAEPMLSLETLS